MAALTEVRNTKELHVGAVHYNYEREVASGTVFAGSLAAQNASGKAVPASDTAGLVVLGRAEATVGAGETLLIRSGAFLFDNGTSTEALTVADIGAVCYIVDDHTVGKVGGTNAIPAGVVMDVTDDGVAVLINPLCGWIKTQLDGKAAAGA
ncbi:MAG: hypothetical protein V8T90_05260 [Victivallales bacterium]